MSLDPAQREQRDEGGDDDGRGKKNRTVDVRARLEDLQALAVQSGVSGRLPLAALRNSRKAPEDALDHDDGRIDDQAEVDCADRQKIGGFPLQDHNADREEQGEWNCRSDDEGGPKIAKE